MIDLRRECSSIYKLKRGVDGKELGYLEEPGVGGREEAGTWQLVTGRDNVYGKSSPPRFPPVNIQGLYSRNKRNLEGQRAG